MVLVGLSKEDQAVEVELERTRLPDSRREAEETERGGVGVPDGVGRAVEEAESSRGEEVDDSTGVVPAVQTGTPPR